MNTWRAALIGGIVALAWLEPAGLVKAAEDAGLRKQVLQLNEVTGTRPIRGQIKLLVDEPAQTKKLLGVAVAMADKKPQPLHYNATLILASAAHQLEQTDAAEKFYRLHAKQALDLLSVQGVVTSYEGLMRVFFSAKKYKECEQACREFVGLPSDDEDVKMLKVQAIDRLILVLALEGQYDAALEICDDLLKKAPDNLVFLDAKGRVLRLAGRNKDAIKLYDEMRKAIENSKDLREKQREALLDDLHYDMSGVYMDLGQIDKAAAELKTLLVKYPDNPGYNNDLGYIWADHDMNLKESERLVRKAIAEDLKKNGKENPAYLDSLGWVLYKQKKFKEAREALLKAVKEKDGQHIEILDHLAEVHLALGEKDKAVAAWKKGLDVAGSNKREQERKATVKKKLKANE
jgi:tetratricopeptide (TPR) repeat protein